MMRSELERVSHVHETIYFDGQKIQSTKREHIQYGDERYSEGSKGIINDASNPRKGGKDCILECCMFFLFGGGLCDVD